MADQKLEIEIAGNTVQLERSMKSINAILQASKAEATSLNRELKFDPTNTELLEKRQKALTTAMEMSKEKASELRKDLENIDPQVNPEGFVKLSRQVNAAESQARSFERQLSATDSRLAELKNKADTFKFDPGTGAVEFSNTLKGVDAALSTINNKKLVNFDGAKAGVSETLGAISQLEDAVSLSERKSQLLRDALSRLDAKVDPEGFAKLQNQIQKTIESTETLKAKQQELYGAIGNVNDKAKQFSFNPGDGIKTFANNIKGIKEALNTLDTKKLLNFDTSTHSLDASRGAIKQLSQAIELTKEKTERLKGEMRNISPSVNSKAFDVLDREIKKAENELQALRNKKVTIQADVGSKFSESLNNAKQITDKTFASMGISGAGAFIERTESKISAGLARISNKIASMFGVTKSFGKAGDEAGEIFNQHLSSKLSGTNATKGLNNVGDSAKNTLGKAGEGAGNSMMNNIGNGVKSGAGAVASTVGKVGHTVANGIATGFKASESVLKSAGESAANVMITPFKGIGSAISTITKGAFLTIGQNITNGIDSTFKGVISTMQETQRASAQLNNVLSFSGVDTGIIKGMTKDLQDYAKQTTYNASETYKVVAGLSASNIEATKARDLTQSIGNSYALLGDGSRKLSEIGTIFSQINSATKLTAQDFNQLKDAGLGGAIRDEIMKANPAIKDFAKAMSDGQISAEMVNAAITKIGSSDAAKKAAFVPKTIGEAFDSLQETVGQKFQGVFANLNAKGIDFVKSFTDAIDGINVDGLNNALMGVINNATNGLKGLVDIGNQIGSGFKKGTESDKSKENLKEADGKFDLNKTIGSINFSDITQKLTEAFIGALPAIANVAKAMGDAFKSADFEGFINKIFEIGQAFFDVVAKFDFSPLVKAFGDLSKAMGKSFKDVDFHSVFEVALTVIQDVVVGIIEAFTAVINFINSDEFKGTFGAVWNTIKDVIGSVKDAIGTMFENIDMSKLEDAGQSMKDLLDSIDGFLKGDFVQSVLDSAAKVTAGLINVASDVAGQIADISADVLDIFKDVDVSGVGDSMVSVFKTAGDGIVEALKPVKNSLDDIKKSDFSKSLNGYVKSSSSSFGSLVNAVNPAVKALGEMGGTNVGFHLDVISGAISGILKVATPFKDFIGYLRDKMKPLGDFIKTVADQFVRIADVLGKGISKKLSEFGDAISKKITPVFDKLKKVLDPIFDSVNGLLKSLSKYAKAGGDAIVGFLEKQLGVSEHSLSGVSANSIGNYNYATSSSVQNNSTVNHVTMTVTGQDGTSILDIARAVKHELELGTV